MSNYEVQYYVDDRGRSSVREYIHGLNLKERAKVLKYIDFLRENEGKLDEPYSRHIEGKIRELRVDFGKNKHRIFYFTYVSKKIILLHAFLKKTAKTPITEINQAKKNYINIIKNYK